MADFQIANYETDAGSSRPIKIASYTLTAWNENHDVNATGAYVRAGGSKAKYGTVARQVNMSRQIGTQAAYSAATVSVSIPMLTKAAYNSIGIGSVQIYNGLEDWVVTGKTAEQTR
jgi:hypothetical protein